SARLTVLIAKSCGHGAHPAIYAAAILGFAISVLTWWSRPPGVARDLAIEPARDVAGSFPRALAVAILLPVALVISGHYGGTWIQALVLAAWGLLLPPIAVPKCDDPRPPRFAYFSAKSAIACAIVGIALTAGLAGSAHYSLDTIAAAIACMHTAGASQATAFIAKEGAEVVKNVRIAREDIAFFAMTVFVSPLFEERIYRGMLQRIASARFGKNRGIAIGGIAFGLAHLGVYRVAIYQAVLLGMTFGITFEEGGLVASIATHAIWNLYLLL
ncbi:MAG: lysostaphin resistance A-like protein, partial [Polyangiaceae bacterium]